MINLDEVLKIHSILIEKFGGSKGIRDEGALDAAIKRPYATFDKKELYPTPIEKAAAIIESIIANHPFVDGNKRTGYVLMRLLLLQNEIDITASEDSKYAFVISISEGKMTSLTIKNWIKENSKKE